MIQPGWSPHPCGTTEWHDQRNGWILSFPQVPASQPVTDAGACGGALDAGYRIDLKAARTSSENSSGSSQAAKWPPLLASLKYVGLG